MAEKEKKEKKGMFGWLDFLPFVGDDDEEIPLEQQFFDHYKKTGTLLNNEEGQPILTYEEAIKLFKSSTDKQYIQFLYSN
jgi:hypothetical protein